MKHSELIDEELPEGRFFRFRDLNEQSTGYSSEFWRKRFRAGEIRGVQRAASTGGSVVLIPRSEVVRYLSAHLRGGAS